VVLACGGLLGWWNGVGKAPYVDTAKKPGRIFMQRLLTEVEKAEIVEREWAKARAKNPKVVMRVDVQDETDESGKPKVSVVVAF
jgi:hypothetical protein